MNSRIVFPTDSLTSLLGCQISFSDLTGLKANLWFSHPVPAHPTVLPQILRWLFMVCSFCKGDRDHFPLTTSPKKMRLTTSVMTRKASMATVATVANA